MTLFASTLMPSRVFQMIYINGHKRHLVEICLWISILLYFSIIFKYYERVSLFHVECQAPYCKLELPEYFLLFCMLINLAYFLLFIFLDNRYYKLWMVNFLELLIEESFLNALSFHWFWHMMTWERESGTSNKAQWMFYGRIPVMWSKHPCQDISSSEIR